MIGACMLPGPLVLDLRSVVQCKQQDTYHDGRQYHAAGLLGLMSPSQAEALLQGKGACGHAEDKADEGYPCVQVACGHTDHHTQRASQEHEGADHDDHSKDKADHR